MPLVNCAALFVLGIALAPLLVIQPAILFALTSLLLLGSLLFLKKTVLSHLSIYGAIFSIGVLAYTLADALPPDHIARLLPHDGRVISVRGKIVDEPFSEKTRYGYHTTATLSAGSLYSGKEWHPVSGLIKVDIYDTRVPAGISFADMVALEGSLVAPAGLKNPGLFDYDEYLALKNIRSRIKVKNSSAVHLLESGPPSPAGYACFLRRALRGAIERICDEPHRGFLRTLFIGDRGAVDKKIEDDFTRTGTVHILSISGSHVGFIACILLMVFRMFRIPKKAALLAAVAVIWVYMLIAGASPPIVRSVIMFAVFALGYATGREGWMVTSLAFAAFAILILNPKELFSPGFQLSFVSVAGIALLSPKIDRALHIAAIVPKRLPGKALFFVAKSVSVTLAAWLAAAPLVMIYFNIFSPVSLFSNLIIIPLVFLIMLAGPAVLLIAWFLPAWAHYGSVAIAVLDTLLFRTNAFLSGIPGAYIVVPALPPAILVGSYGLIAALLMERHERLKALLIIMALGWINVVVWTSALDAFAAKGEATFLDVGQGDSAVLRFPRRGTIVVDGGPGGDDGRFDTGRSVIRPYLWKEGITRLDALIVSHLHEDHLGGIPYLLENFNIGCVIDSGAFPSGAGALYGRYTAAITKRKIRRLTVRAGDEIGGFDNTRIIVMNPPAGKEIADSNENSLAFKISYLGNSFLFLGDVNGVAMKNMAAYGDTLSSDIVKVPHHGGQVGDGTTVKTFFSMVQPRIFVISVGRNNVFHMPSPKTMDILNSFEAEVYETKESGALAFIFDGKTVEKSKGNYI